MSADNIEAAVKWGFILVIVILLGKAIAKIGQLPGFGGFKTLGDQFRASTEGTVSGASEVVTTQQPLTRQQALAIATALGAGLNYQLSPDSFQIWFFNGSFYDTRTKHVTAANGSDAGLAFDVLGAANNAAVNAVTDESQAQATESVDTTDSLDAQAAATGLPL